MQLFDTVAILLAITALFSYLNARYLRFHPSIGVMIIAMLLSLGLLALERLGVNVRAPAERFLLHVKFDDVLLHWMLGFLLFAGALTVDVYELRRQWGIIALLATGATAASMFLVAGLSWAIFDWLGIAIPWLACLLFGSLISPTDPVAVVAVMRKAGAPKNVETIVAAESLFNDGVGVVLFLTLLEISQPGAHVTVAGVSRMLVQEVVGGIALGLVTGFLVNFLLQRTREFQVEVLLTLALVMGTYSLAGAMHFSAPIAVVIAGLVIGYRGKKLRLSAQVQDDLDHFWELLDEILNAILFVLIGLEVLVMHGSHRQIVAALVCIPATLLARWIAVIGCAGVFPAARRITRPVRLILVWGGLRGGLAVAMALALPESEHREVIILITYAVVCFSILIQGMTIRPLVRRAFRI